MKHGFRLHYSCSQLLTDSGFGKVAKLPCIFDSRPGYHRLGSQYLIDRGLGLWDPRYRGRGTRMTPPTPVSIRTFGDWLCNFLEWGEIRGIDLFECDYSEHIGGRYQQEMFCGLWSRDGRPLAPKTVNMRVQQACDFICWLADKGYRKPFLIPQETFRIKTESSTSSVGHKTLEVTRRLGKIRLPKRRLRLPNDLEVREWLKRVYAKFGQAKGLMAELILLTAIRREEAACWRVDSLPINKSDWHIVNPHAPFREQIVLVDIKYGCKGKAFGEDHGDKIGPQGTIRVPLPFAERLHSYWMTDRNIALKKWVKAGQTLAAQKERIANSVHLFLDERTGERVSAKALYSAWTGVELPFNGWSPHLGRDWWACSVLWSDIKRHEHLLKTVTDIPNALLESIAMSVIRLQIQPQLRHAHPQTTMIYLQWVSDMVGFNLSVQYEQSLEESA